MSAIGLLTPVELYDGWALKRLDADGFIIKGIDHGSDMGETVAKQMAKRWNAFVDENGDLDILDKQVRTLLDLLEGDAIELLEKRADIAAKLREYLFHNNRGEGRP